MFEEASRHDVGVIARTTLESGCLSGKYRPGHTFPAHDHRRRWDGASGADLAADRGGEEVAVRPPYETPSQIAIRFALQTEAVSSVIVGARTTERVCENMSMADELRHR
jgi:aryl-alcohol dehydrogenase-like predicted oxidoreductase